MRPLGPRVTPRRARDPQVSYVVDPTAEPGDPLPALVKLLIGIRRKRQERAAAELAGDKPQAEHQAGDGDGGRGE
jgi:hypothetical protein